MATAPTAPIADIWPSCSSGQIRFFWRPPTSDGGDPITKYTLACTAISFSQDLSANVTNYTATGLTNATDYAFTITATNAIGASPAASFPVVQPGARPFGPQQATVSTLNTSTALVTWTPSTITAQGSTRGYIILCYPSTTAMSSFSETQDEFYSSMTFTGLSTNIYYRFLVQGINDVGYCVPFAFTSTLGFGISAGNTAFSPSSLTGMRLWIDAQDSSKVTLSSGSTITALTDKAGGSFTFSNVSGYGYTPSSFNTSYPSFTAPGAAGNTLGANASFTLSNPNTMFFVGKRDKVEQFNFVYATPANNHALFNQGNWAIFAGTQVDNMGLSNTTLSNALVSVVYNGASSMFVQNGSTTNVNVNPGTSNISGLLLGQWYNAAANYGWGGNFCEIMMYSNVLTPFDRQKVEGYLSWKWGLQSNLPTTHPFYTAAPTATSVFSPSSFSGLQVWLDANDPLGTGVTPSNGTSITTWADKSGNGRNATSASTAATVVTDALNSKAVLNAVGTSRYNVTYSSIPASYSAFAIYTITSNDGLYQRVIHGGSDYLLFMGVQGGQNVATFGGNGSTWNDVAANSPTISALNNWRMVGMTNNSSNTQLIPYTDGSAQTAKTGSATSFNDLVIMSHTNASDPQKLRGRLAEVLFYNRVISADDRQTVEGYLAWKWGLQGNLPLTHPYKYNNPAALTTFTPRSLSSLRIWLDGSDTASLTLSGASVTTWADKSVNGYNATGIVAPQYNSTTKYITFNGSSQHMTLPTGAYPSGDTPYSILIISYTNDSASPQWIIAGGAEGTNQALGVVYNVGTILHTWWGNEFSSPAVITNTSTTMIEAFYSASTRTTILNGGQYSTVNSPAASRNNATSPNIIGRRPGTASQFVNGGIAEIVVFNGELATADRQKVEGYLAWKWGLQGNLPSSHPYKAAAP
jgi:hypothetical protein